MSKTTYYVCIPFRSNPAKNRAVASIISKRIWLMGHVPVCPHLATAAPG